ncbi:gas vesicle protein [Streptomyces sp. ISL-10]|uniref:gas vesicle protein n=1 Tax=Streptomyces sp. ISL-10 TaxID=2819172 RepID=UPI0027E43A45|nr:gas vesicle protein [Streptomyces sp. ISL-10]
MTHPLAGRTAASPYGQQGSSANLADILERVLDKGIVIAGDIRIDLLDIELLTIKLRLLVASVDKAKEMGIDWWEHDPSLSSRARQPRQAAPSGPPPAAVDSAQPDAATLEPTPELTPEQENARLRAELAELRAAVGPTQADTGTGTGRDPHATTEGRDEE